MFYITQMNTNKRTNGCKQIRMKKTRKNEQERIRRFMIWQNDYKNKLHLTNLTQNEHILNLTQNEQKLIFLQIYKRYVKYYTQHFE